MIKDLLQASVRAIKDLKLKAGAAMIKNIKLNFKENEIEAKMDKFGIFVKNRIFKEESGK